MAASKSKRRKQTVSIVFLTDKICSETVAEFQKQLLEAEMSGDVVLVRICSPGGDVEPGMAIFDSLLLCSKPVVTEAWGHCASMAALILMAGAKRRIAPNATVMIHDVRACLNGTMMLNDTDRLSKSLRSINDKYKDLMSKRTGNSIKALSQWMEKETYFTAEEALKYGFVDEIIGAE